MPLNWDSSKCSKPTRASEGLTDRDAVIRETIVLLMPVMRIGQITEKNWKELYARLKFAEQFAGGAFMHVASDDTTGRFEPKGIEFKPEHVKRWIGLTTNVVTESRIKFLKSYERELDDTIRRDCKNL